MTDLTREETAELELLRHGTSEGKFAISISAHLSLREQEALERLQIKRWITLIDVSLIAHDTGVHRIFLMSSDAIRWRDLNSRKI